MEILDDVMFEQKLGQVKKQPSEKDRERLLRNLRDNFYMTGEQACKFCAECHNGQAKMTAAKILYECVREEERENFVRIGLDTICKYPEDKKEFCELFGVENKPSETTANDTGPKVSSFDKQSVSGYTA
mmetsp:Transcript_4022/g.5873  ORF Transcript_4022/g.5873 Transcript_4022/m.5873 type:complete len:129 (+) Transcript_4022:1914-2300(+)